MEALVSIHATEWHVCSCDKPQRSTRVYRKEEGHSQSRTVLDALLVEIRLMCENARQKPDMLSAIPTSSLRRLAHVRLVGKYERKLLSAYMRLQNTYSEYYRAFDGEKASFQDLMRLLLRASDLTVSNQGPVIERQSPKPPIDPS